MEKKLKSLLSNPVSDGVMTSAWLRAAGFSSQLVSKYVRSAWLMPVGHGAYARDVSRISWQQGLHALQTQLNLPIWLGGVSALTLRGMGHQLALGRERIWLYSYDATHLPKWFSTHDWSAEIVLVNRRLFLEQQAVQLTELEVAGVMLTASRPERAILECLDRVQGKATFEDASDLMTGMSTLSPRRMQASLQTCRSIRAKRLALYLADLHQLPWREQLVLNHIDLGSGPRQIVPNGRLDNQYHITVPRGYDDAG